MPRILVIDDDEAIRRTVQLMLENAAFDVVVAENGRAGVTALTEAPADLAIVDIFMPEMEGLETIMTLRRLAPRLPIIAMSGSSPGRDGQVTPDFLNMAMHFGATRRMQKPFRSEDLLQAVWACLSR
jgi:CheY-like chemotaxis protein